MNRHTQIEIAALQILRKAEADGFPAMRRSALYDHLRIVFRPPPSMQDLDQLYARLDQARRITSDGAGDELRVSINANGRIWLSNEENL